MLRRHPLLHQEAQQLFLEAVRLSRAGPGEDHHVRLAQPRLGLGIAGELQPRLGMREILVAGHGVRLEQDLEVLDDIGVDLLRASRPGLRQLRILGRRAVPGQRPRGRAAGEPLDSHRDQQQILAEAERAIHELRQ